MLERRVARQAVSWDYGILLFLNHGLKLPFYPVDLDRAQPTIGWVTFYYFNTDVL